MSISFQNIFYTLVLVSLHVAGSIPAFNSNSTAEIKCIESERQALLNFKQRIRDDYGMLSTWSDDDNNRDCCNWNAIQCNNQTGHVQMLHLRGNDAQYLTGAINLTSLIALQNIQHLDLSYNDFQESHIPELLGLFINLRYLNLSSSCFDGRIPYELGNLSQLKYLDLSGNSLSGAIPFQVGDLPFLHTLRLGGNFDLQANDPKWLSSLSLLSTLDLSSLPNVVSSRHWLQLINELIPNLRELRLVHCYLSDNNFSSLFRFHSISNLSILDLSQNMLTSSMFQLLSNYSLNLRELYLSRNDIVLSSPHYLNFPSLEILDLSYNNLISAVFQGNFNFSYKLRELHLASCSLTDRSFLLPSASIKNSLC